MRAIEEMFTIEPPPARLMAGMACLVPRNTPLALTAMRRSHSSSLVSSIPLGMMERDMRPPGALNIGGGLPDHVRGQINADDPATWAHLLCRGKLHGPSTGGHVQHGSPRREVG